MLRQQLQEELEKNPFEGVGRIIDQLVWPEKNTSEDMCAKEVCVFFCVCAYDQ